MKTLKILIFLAAAAFSVGWLSGQTIHSSASIVQVVKAPVPVATAAKVSVVSSVNPATVGQSVTFTATVADTSTGPVPTGTVGFYNGTTLISTGTLVNGVTTCVLSTAGIAPGSYTVNAIYNGDSLHF